MESAVCQEARAGWSGAINEPVTPTDATVLINGQVYPDPGVIVTRRARILRIAAFVEGNPECFSPTERADATSAKAAIDS